MIAPSDNFYMRCNCCNTGWSSVKSLIDDSEIKIAGYQASFDDTDHGWIIFHHDKKECLIFKYR